MSEAHENAPGVEATPGAGDALQKRERPEADPPQKEAARLTSIDGGRGDDIHTLLDLSQFGKWARANRLTEANLKAAWRTGTVDGYPGRVATARFDDGALIVSGELDEPDETQRRALEQEFKEEQPRFPKLIPLTAIAEPPPGVDLNSPDTFVCHDMAGKVVMIHQRYSTDDGGKGYIPWTRWSDGEWRKVEPETLPFYGAHDGRDAASLVLHEGAKAAQRVRSMVAGEADASRFPWFEQTRLMHHVGWIGGTNAVDRSDWAALAARGYRHVYVVADNDKKGLKAARKIARQFPGTVYVVSVDQRFPAGFDLADPFPGDLFDEWGAYTGPTWADCLVPATLATVELPSDGPGRPPVVVRDEFAAMVSYTVEPEQFVFAHQPSRTLPREAFNAKVAPFSHVKDTATKVLARLDCQHERLVYDPSSPSGTLILDGMRCLNVHAAPHLIARDGDEGPWSEFLDHLIPDAEERALVVRWLATLIAKPGERLRYGLLLISMTQGVGKGTLAHVLKRIIGIENMSFPSEKAVVDSQFNGWLARKRVVFIAEIYSGHKRKAYDDLKAVMSDDTIEVNLKHVPAFTLRNWATVIACSNSEAALHLDDEDRRWLVPTVAECGKPPDWWQRFYRWVDGPGAAIIKRWAEREVERGNYVRTGEHAPWSKRKRAIAEASRSEGQQLAVSLAEYLTGLDQRVILRMSDVRKWIARERGFTRGSEPDLSDRRLEKPATVAAAMKKVSGITVWADNLRPKFGATREAVVMNFRPSDGDAWADLKCNLTDLAGLKLDGPF